MTIERKDRIKDTTSSTGTGTITVDGASITGYRPLSTHTSGATVRYLIISPTQSEWEVGEGVWTAAGSTLSRVTVFASSNAGSKVNFSAGVKYVSTLPTAQDLDDSALPFALGTAAALNVPATGNAASGEVVKGDDTRLSDARTPTSHTHPASAISDSTATGRAILTAADAAAARSAIGAGTSSFDGNYASLSGAPTLGTSASKDVGTAAGTVAAGDHTHSAYAAAGAVTTSGLTMATARLLGRSTAGTGAVEEITLGTNLSFSGTTLNAAGGGGTPGGSDTQVQYNSAGAFAGASGITTTGSELTIASGSKTANAPILNLSQTWNNSGVSFTGLALDVTPTAYASGSKVIKVTYNNKTGTYFSIDPAGYATFGFDVHAGGINASSRITASTDVVVTGGVIYLANSGDTTIRRSGAGVAAITEVSSTAYRDLKLRNLIGTGNLATGAVAKSADYTATTSDGTIEVDASGAARTITLFAASGNAGKIIVVKKTDSSVNTVTIDGNASETIDGASMISLVSQYSTAILQVNASGTGWNTLGTGTYTVGGSSGVSQPDLNITRSIQFGGF